MYMLIKELMNTQLKSVGADESMSEVEKLLDENELHCVPVLDAMGGCFGVITVSDIVHLKRSKEYERFTKAWEVCTHIVYEVEENTPINECVNMMVEKQVHHLIVTSKGALVGLVSSLDLLKVLSTSFD